VNPPKLPKEDRNFTASRALFCAILEQAVDDWRTLQRAGRIPMCAARITVAGILHGKPSAIRMNRKDVASLLDLLTTSALDRYCAHMNAIIKPEGIRRALGIPEPTEESSHD